MNKKNEIKIYFSHIFFSLRHGMLAIVMVVYALSAKKPMDKNLSIRDFSHKIFLQNKNISISEVPIAYKNGILFTHIGPDDAHIEVSGSFISWQKRLKMQQSSHGIFFVFWEGNLPSGKYDYRININGFWENDKKQLMRRINKKGQEITYFILEKDIHHHKNSPEYLSEKKFRFYLLDKNYKDVRWIGSENRFDPQSDKMKLSNGYWTIDKRIEEKKSFYAYFVDGKLMLDPHNQNLSATDFGLELNSIPIYFYKKP